MQLVYVPSLKKRKSAMRTSTVYQAVRSPWLLDPLVLFVTGVVHVGREWDHLTEKQAREATERLRKP